MLTLQDSAINLRSLSWMPFVGINLHSSKLHVVMPMPDSVPQFWAEMIVMDEKSEVVSHARLTNYGHYALEDFGKVLNYVAEPEGGKFFKLLAYTDKPNTIGTEVEGELAVADHFVLRAPAGGSEEGPGDGGNEDGTGGSTGGETDGGSKNPATGDSGVVLYIAIAVVAVGGAAAVIVCRNKKKDN